MCGFPFSPVHRVWIVFAQVAAPRMRDRWRISGLIPRLPTGLPTYLHKPSTGSCTEGLAWRSVSRETASGLRSIAQSSAARDPWRPAVSLTQRDVAVGARSQHNADRAATAGPSLLPPTTAMRHRTCAEALPLAVGAARC